MRNLQNRFSSTPIHILTLPVLAMLTCHVAKAAMANLGDSTAWTPSMSGTGMQLSTVNNGNGLQVDFSAGAQPGAAGGMGGGYLSTFSFQGDFAVQMNYNLSIWPSGNNGVRLGISFGPNLGTERLDSILMSGNAYLFSADNPTTWTATPTADQSGSLEMARVGNTISGYYWSNASQTWVLIGSATRANYSQAFPIWITSWTEPGEFCHQPVEVTLSDVQITSAVVPAITPVPEPTTMLAGALALLPVGFTALRSLRKRHLA